MTSLLTTQTAMAAFTSPYSLGQFTTSNTVTDVSPGCAGTPLDGNATGSLDGSLVRLLGSNMGSGCLARTGLTISAVSASTISFTWTYALDTLGSPDDVAGYILGTAFTQLGTTNGQTGNVSFLVNAGQTFGFYVDSDDQGDAGALSITNFNVAPTGVPEPGTIGLAALGLGAVAWMRKRARRKAGSGTLLAGLALAALFGYSEPAAAQPQANYTSTVVTGIMSKVDTFTFGTNPLGAAALGLQAAPVSRTEKVSADTRNADSQMARGLGRSLNPLAASFNSTSAATMASLPITTQSLFGFNALTHKDQRDAYGGNQFSIEPPNQSIAVGNGYILEGVNSAVRVYSLSGGAVTSIAAANEVFKLPPPINRALAINNRGPYGTDMRVYYDQQMDRFFILQRFQDVNAAGNAQATSRIYIAVSRTNDPRGAYDIYNMDTTHLDDVPTPSDPFFHCPCVADYPQIGSDQYGFYIAVNEYITPSATTFASASVYAISKRDLLDQQSAPRIARFSIRRNPTFFEFSLQPATTAPGASSFLASGGVEYLASTVSLSTGNEIALWAIANTSSLGLINGSTRPAPALTMARIQVPTLPYTIPNLLAGQKQGPLPLGSNAAEYFPPITTVKAIDGGDDRMQSLTYAGGKLYASWATGVTDEDSRPLVGSSYLVLTPTYRTGVLTARRDLHGYLQVRGNNLLRPAWAVNSRGKGAIVVTLVGNDYFPSVAYLPVDITGLGTSPSIKIVAAGAGPQDGFTGYDEGLHRWGDYSTAVASADGNIWMVGQYIPNLPRSLYANWGTYIFRFTP